MSIGSTTRLKLWAPFAIPALALAMLALTLVPGQAWRSPATDARYEGFDPNFIYTSSGGSGGSVRVGPSSLEMAAAPDSRPTANLLTTSLQEAVATVDVSIVQNDGASEPFRVGVWSPWTKAGQFIVFGPAPQDLILAETIRDGDLGPTLTGGHVTSSTVLGRYSLGARSHLTFNIDKARGVIRTAVLGADGTRGESSLASSTLPAMFGTDQLSLTASSSPGPGSSRVLLDNYGITLPHQRAWTSNVDDPRAAALLVALAVAGGIAIAIALAAWLPRRLRPAMPARFRLRPVMLGAVGLYLAGNALLFPLGSHPFDMGAEQLYAYVARVYGTAQLYFLPNVVSLAGVWSGIPYGESAFPYEPVTAYLSTATGWLTSLLFAGGGNFPLDSSALEYTIKSVNVVFGLFDAALIYKILKRTGAGERWSLIPAALFLFNPAVWYSMSIWGQTHVISLFFVLAAILLAENQLPVWAWLSLAAACLTRPQMVVFGLLLGTVFLRKFSWRENLSAISWTVIGTFVALSPLTLATSPSLPVDVMLHNFNVQEASGNNPALTTVSQGAYSIWPLVTYLAHGASRLERAFTPSSETLFGTITYQRAGQLLTVAALLVIVGILWFKRRATDRPGAYVPLVALGIASFLMLLTGIVSTHFLLALPLLLLCRRWMSGPAYFFVAGAWTITTLVPMFGDMGVALMNHGDQLLSPVHTPITRFVISLYSWDRFITAGVVANICALVWLAVLAVRSPTPAMARP